MHKNTLSIIAIYLILLIDVMNSWQLDSEEIKLGYWNCLALISAIINCYTSLINDVIK